MTCLEALNSSDQEIAELHATLLYSEIGIDALKEELKTNKKYIFSHIYKGIVYLEKINQWNWTQSNIFLKDSNRSLLIDIK